MNEADIMRLVQIRASELGARVHRNNVGMVMRPDGIPLRYGLGVGSSDLIGWTAEGRFLAIEVKTPTGSVKKEQAQFLAAVNAAGGLGFVARSPLDVDKNLIKE